jgi:hypothetical protein
MNLAPQPDFEPPRSFRPTSEQEAAVRAFLGSDDLKLVAVAGSGKTTTLRMMAEAAGGKRLLYVAFNNSVKQEAEAKFPRHNTQVRTLHGYAHKEVVGEPYREKANRGANGLPITALEETLGSPFSKAFPNPVDRRIRFYVVRDTLKRFLNTTAPEPGPEHIPSEFKNARRLKKSWPLEENLLVKAARVVWKKMRDPRDPFPLTHDGYVRMWYDAGGAVSGFDTVLVDEAQDLDPVFLEILKRSPLQRVYVGDPRQQIYAWRGAVNAMAKIEAPESRLTRSFRFGEELAQGVRRITRLFGEEVPVVGEPSLRTEVRVLGECWPSTPFAVLARTNAGVLDALLEIWTTKSIAVHVVGGVDDLIWLLRDAHALRWNLERTRPRPELAGVSTWEEVESLASEGLDPLMERLVRLAKRYPDLASLANTVERAHVEDEDRAGAVLSTVHKAKGREWGRVVLWDDFPRVWDPKWREIYRVAGREEELREQENILYVAMTRARELLLLAFGMEGLYAIGWGDGEDFIGGLLPELLTPQVPQKPLRDFSPQALEVKTEQVVDLSERIITMLDKATGEVFKEGFNRALKQLETQLPAQTQIVPFDPKAMAQAYAEALIPALSDIFTQNLRGTLAPLVEQALVSLLPPPDPKPPTDAKEVSGEGLQTHHETDAESQEVAIVRLAAGIASYDPYRRGLFRLATIVSNRVETLGSELGEKYLATLASMPPTEAIRVFSRGSKDWIQYLRTGEWPS